MEAVARLKDVPEILSFESLRRNGGAIQLQRPGAPLLHAQFTGNRRHQVISSQGPAQPQQPRDRARHSPQAGRDRRAAAHVPKWSSRRPDRRCWRRCWPKSTAQIRRHAAPWPPRCGRLSKARPSSSISTIPMACRRAQAHRHRSGLARIFGVQQGDVFDTLHRLYGDQVVGYSHRGEGRQPLPIRMALAKDQRRVDETMLTTPVPPTPCPATARLSNSATWCESRKSLPPSRSSATMAARRKWCRRNGRDLRSPSLRLASGGCGARQDEVDGGDAQAANPVAWPTARRKQALAAVGRRMGSHLGDVQRHGAAFIALSSASIFWWWRSSRASNCRW